VDAGIVVLQYTTYLLEAGLLAYLLLRRRAGRLSALTVYVGLLLAVDAISRPYFLYRFGFASPQYASFFWLTDVLLVLAAFGLIAAFFRRACAREHQLWRHIRLLLTVVLILVAGVSWFSLSQYYNQLFTQFIIEFQQNLYFTCLVLNTLLFLLIQKLALADGELTLLVSGLGIQFAGPAGNFALVHLTAGSGFGNVLYTYLGPLCTLGMLSTWFVAVARVPRTVRVPELGPQVAEMAVTVGRRP